MEGSERNVQILQALSDDSEMAPKLKGTAGPTYVDAVALSSWLPCFGLALTELREEMAH